jgi:hypothetical protein
MPYVCFSVFPGNFVVKSKNIKVLNDIIYPYLNLNLKLNDKKEIT